MKKVILIVSICIAIVFSTVALIVVFASGNSAAEDIGDVITQKETAIKIGRALLEEYAQTSSWSYPFEDGLDAEEKDGIWKVYNVIERQGITEDGEMWVLKGGGVYVEFRKDNGRVIKIGVDD